MESKLGRLWKFITSSETTEGVANASEKVFALAETLQDKENLKNPQIQELVEKIPTLLEALNSPLGNVIESSVPFLPIATGVIRFALEVNKQEPTVAETVAIVCQAAYLESISKTIPSELIPTEEKEKDFPEVKRQLNKLKDLEIDYEEATLALVYFHESKIAEAFNQVLFARLEVMGIAQSEVQTWVDKVALNTQQYISQALAEAAEEIAVVERMLDWYISGGKEEFIKRRSINYYLEEKIKSLPEEPVFKEKFSFQDIYVPLQAISLNAKGEETEYSQKFILDKWAQKFITNAEESEKVLFIQAGAGRGKSVFCRMFADWVRRNLHPVITPIVIRLRDIKNYNRPIDEILSSTLSSRDFVKNDPAWLTDSHTRYLFLLDGFDELRMEGRASGGIEEFIRQVGQFQRDFSGKETGHRLIVTGRPIALQGISYLPQNLSRVKLLPMNDEIQWAWFAKWQQVVIPDNLEAAKEETEKLQALLSGENCPREIKKELAREPLLLYLLAKLHRPDQEGNRKIQLEDFGQAGNKTNAKILVYEKSLELVLKEQREEWLQHQITGLDTASLERILTEAGLCVVQSGGEYARVEMIETRLEKDDSDAAEIIKELRAKSGEKALSTALGAFYIRPAGGEKGGGVEFYHKSFGEYLCAKRLQQSLESWTTLVKVGRQQQWFISKEELARQIYDLLGYGGLTPEIVEYLWGLLTKSAEFKPVELFQRLSDFYWRWCDGEFIDAERIILPHLKMLELKEQLPDRETYLGLRQVDVYAGLNIIILLLELHRYGQSQYNDIKQKLTFYPCGQPQANGELEDQTLLLRLIGYSNCLGASGFRDTVGRFLDGANLNGANLSGVNLNGANLEDASLSGANLSGANLEGANLNGANLEGTNLSGANLSGANLSGANLEGAYFFRAKIAGANLEGAYLYGASLDGSYLENANLYGANLYGTYLSGAYLSGADLSGADLDAITWDASTNWNNVRGLDQAINVPEELKRQLSL
ncbi:MAG: pentapeptide repeat-containing protein [Cyanobacteria bacterium J06621_8]